MEVLYLKNQLTKPWMIFVVLFSMFVFTQNNITLAKLKTIPGVVNSYKHIDRVLHESDFDFLYKGMSLDEIVKTVGEPNGMIGSGILSPFYELEEDSIIVLFFDSDYKMLRIVDIVDENGISREVKLKTKE